MPSIIGIYREHPETGEPGDWVQLTNGGIVGVADKDKPGLDPIWTLEEASTQATAYAQAIVGSEVRVEVEGLKLDPWTYRLHFFDSDLE